VDRGSNDPRFARAAGGGARPVATRDTAAAQRGLGAGDAPFIAGFAPGHPAVHDEHHGDLQGLRRLRETADGGEAWRRSSGEDGSVTRCTAARANGT
jgi:hypothetical protein